MSYRIAILSLVMALGLCAGSAADWLVLRGGKKIETSGLWKVKDDLITVHEASGRTQAVTFEVVDFPATLQANVRAGMPASASVRRAAGAQAGDPGKMDLETLKRLQEVARLRAEAAAQARQLNEAQLRAALSGVAPKQPRTGDQSGESSSSKSGRPQYNNGIADCAIYQDRPRLYSDCLAKYH